MGFITSAVAAVIGRLRTCNLGWTWYFRWTGGKVNHYVFFSPEEIQNLDSELCAMLDMARARAGVPFILTSGFRTATDNSKCGGVGHSSHCEGLGVDIGLGGFEEGLPRDRARRMIRKGLEVAGFNRYGSYPNHIHVDIGKDPDYTQDVEWFSTAEG